MNAIMTYTHTQAVAICYFVRASMVSKATGLIRHRPNSLIILSSAKCPIEVGIVLFAFF